MTEGSPQESTAVLLVRARAGDDVARTRLVQRVLPALQRWAHGRLPGYARAGLETDDLVQVALIRALDHLDDFTAMREGAFLAYLRRILLNSVRDELRRTARRGGGAVEVPDTLADASPSLLEHAMGREVMEAYEAALAQLTEEQQEAVILRIEFGYSHQEIADALGRPSENAARMVVARALARLAESMKHVAPDS